MIKDEKAIKQACNNYLNARMEFLKFANSLKAKGLLNGNDNIIGSRIGEFIAWQLLDDQKRKPKINNLSNVKDFDIICDNGPQKVSVKLISPENKLGRTTRIGNIWDEFILILLDSNYKIESIGQITKKQFEQDKKISKNPYVSRRMLGKKGLFNRVKAKINLKKDCQKYL
jgi:hypothetical protein